MLLRLWLWLLMLEYSRVSRFNVIKLEVSIAEVKVSNIEVNVGVIK